VRSFLASVLRQEHKICNSNPRAHCPSASRNRAMNEYPRLEGKSCAWMSAAANANNAMNTAVSHCLSPRLPASVSWILASMGVAAI